MPVLAIASAVGVAGRSVGGHPDPFYFLTTYSIALFFLGGQLFREALFATAAMIIASGQHSLTAAKMLLPYLSIRVVLTIYGCGGCVRLQRRGTAAAYSFLERGLMGELVARDGLTGLKNRGAFDDYFPRMWQQALRDRRSLALLLIDVDHFKPYNDRYGHQAGDQTLRRVAQVVQAFARRPLDIAARYGGEEFVLALFDLSSDNIREMAEQLRKAIHDLNILHEDSATAAYVTASIGVCHRRPRMGRSPEAPCKSRMKRSTARSVRGRNCVSVVDSDQIAVFNGHIPAPRLT